METTDILSRSLRIIQERRGHRAASDDVLLAWAAIRAQPHARTILDLGSGKGTVAFLILRCLPTATAIGIEAYEPHHELAVRNAALNRLSDRYEARLGDLRDPGALGSDEVFHLICGAPPYIPAGNGILPSDPGRAAGRFELRGGVEAYAQTAARHLAEGGRVVVLMHGAGRTRAESAVSASGLFTCRSVAVRPRPAHAPTYWVIEAAAGYCGMPPEEELCMRLADGQDWSPEYSAIRDLLDLP